MTWTPRSGGPKFGPGAKVLALLNGAWVPAVVVSYLHDGLYKVRPRYLGEQADWHDFPTIHRKAIRSREVNDG